MKWIRATLISLLAGVACGTSHPMPTCSMLASPAQRLAVVAPSKPTTWISETWGPLSATDSNPTHTDKELDDVWQVRRVPLDNIVCVRYKSSRRTVEECAHLGSGDVVGLCVDQ